MDILAMMYPVREARTANTINSVAFIDPGLGGTGVAVFPQFSTKATKRTVVGPVATECFTAKRKTDIMWQSQVADITTGVVGFLSALAPASVFIEWPEVWADSAVSMAAATKSGLGKMYYLIGSIAEALRGHPCGAPLLGSPGRWKGQLPKEIVTQRIVEVFGRSYGNHVDDAVGMGLSAQGMLV